MSKVVTGIDKSGSFRVYVTITTDMVEEARKIHDTTPLATAGLGRTLTGAGIMGILLKSEDEKLTVQFKGDGPAQQILACANGRGDVKGYIVNPDVDLPLTEAGKLDVGGAVGKDGTLSVVKDIGLKEPYVGVSELVSGEIAEDLAYYLAKSEQTKSIVSLGVLLEGGAVSEAGGLMIQLLPGAGEEEIDYLEKRAAGFPEISYLFKEGFTPAQIIDLFVGDPDLKYLDGQEVEFKCNCSRERMFAGLAALGKSDLEEITKEGKPVETVCRFCNSKYVFEADELKKD